MKSYEIKNDKPNEENEGAISIMTDSLVNDALNKAVIYNKLPIEISKINSPNKKKQRMKRRSNVGNVDEKKNKLSTIQIKNNKTAIENLEIMVIELHSKYENRHEEIVRYVEDMKTAQCEKIIDIKNENKKIMSSTQEQFIYYIIFIY